MKPTILLDLDDTIADFKSAMYKSMKTAFGNVKHYNKWNTYNLTDHCGQNINDILNLIVNDNVLENLLPYDHSAYLIEQLYKDNNIVIVTSRHYHPNAKRITKNWLMQNKIPFDSVHITGADIKKSDIAKMYNVKYAVDDHIENCLDYQMHGYNCILFNQPWNRSHKHNRDNISSLHELLPPIYLTKECA